MATPDPSRQNRKAKAPAEEMLLLHRPNSHTIWNRVMERIEDEAREQAGAPDSDAPVINLAESSRLAPDLQPIIQETMESYQLPDQLLQRLDQEQQACADRALNELPPVQRERLFQAALARLQPIDE